jgi:hypothetical protein
MNHHNIIMIILPVRQELHKTVRIVYYNDHYDLQIVTLMRFYLPGTQMCKSVSVTATGRPEQPYVAMLCQAVQRLTVSAGLQH